MGNKIATVFVYIFAGLAFALAIGAARFGFPALYGFAGLSGCLAAFITIVQRA
jgi:hypothetical protein